jgi:hypothetical protein
MRIAGSQPSGFQVGETRLAELTGRAVSLASGPRSRSRPGSTAEPGGCGRARPAIASERDVQAGQLISTPTAAKQWSSGRG